MPESSDDFRPHVSLAYSNTAGPAEPIVERMAARRVISAEVTVRGAALPIGGRAGRGGAGRAGRG